VTCRAPTWRLGCVVRALAGGDGLARTGLRGISPAGVVLRTDLGLLTGAALRLGLGVAFALGQTRTTCGSRCSSIAGTSVLAGERQSASAAARGITTAAATMRSTYLTRSILLHRGQPAISRR
jgi:hypothetical protein